MAQGEVKIKSTGPTRPDLHAFGTNVDITVTLPAQAAKHELGGVYWSYSADPEEGAPGRLTIMGGGWHFDVDITTGGPGFILFPSPAHADSKNVPIVITLYAGGAGIVGKLNVINPSTD